MPFAEPVTLKGAHASLEPLTAAHAAEAGDAARDGELWKLWYTAVAAPEDMPREVERRLGLQKAGSMLPFAVRDATGRFVGMTTYMNIDALNRRLEIGSTWIAESAQRGPLNTECKLLLLTQAFETLGCIAVEFRTHFLNQQSRRAIERLGARLDGILRNHTRTANGMLRDTCVYSIIESEWPTVKAHLQWQMARPR
jgi:N-acetyltransferase